MGGGIIKYVVRLTPTLLLLWLLPVPLLALIYRWMMDAREISFLSLINLDTFVLIGKSLLLSSIVALLATIIGTVCGFLLNKLQFTFSRLYKLLLLLPLLVSPYIFAVAWKDSFQWFFGSTSAIYSEAGVITVHTLVFFPLAMLITGSAFVQIHAGIEEAGLMVVPFPRMVRKIIIPLIRPAYSISFLLILIFSLSDFSVPAFFGVRTFTTEIFTQFSAFYNYQLAIGQSVLLLLVCLALMLMEARYLSDSPFFSVDVRGSSTKQYTVNQRKALLHFVLWLLLFFAIIFPVFILVYQSFSGREIFFVRAWELISPTVFQSVKLALLGASLICLIGLWVAYMRERSRFHLPNTLLLLVFIVPSTVLGIAAIGFYNKPSTNFIYGTLLIILICYIGRFGFIAARILGNGIKQVHVSLEEAAAIIGISPLKRFATITLPLLLPSLFVAFVLSFVLCLGELGTTIMVYPPGTELMSVKIFTISANAPQALTSSMTLISFGITMLFIVLFFLIGKKVFEKFRFE